MGEASRTDHQLCSASVLILIASSPHSSAATFRSYDPRVSDTCTPLCFGLCASCCWASVSCVFEGPLTSHHMECSGNVTFGRLIFSSSFGQKEAPVPGPGILLSLRVLRCSLSLGLSPRGWQSLRPQGFFATSTTCCPDSRRLLSLPTWPPHCPLGDA